jgi:MFS family permease
VLFDSVLYDRCELKGSWGRWEPCGRSYFYWCLAISVGSFAGFAVLTGVPLLLAWRAGLFHHPGQYLVALILGGAVLLFILIAFFVLDAIAALFAKDFCVPIMAMEKVGVLDAWRRLLPMLGADKLAFAGYVLMKIVLAIGAAIMVGIATILSFIILLIPMGIAAVVVFFGGKAIGLTWNVATISILVVLGVVILTGFIYLIALINTPPMVFFQSYMLHFFGSRYPALGAVVFPPPRETPPPPFDEPPIFEPSIG